MTKMQNKVKVLVIGIDSGDWDVISPLMERGELTNLARFVNEGVYGYLKSTIPPSTLPAWKSYSTGRYRLFREAYWYTFDPKSKSLRVADLGEIQELLEIWDYLSVKGYKVGVINIPASYPPKRVNGIFVSGFPAQDYMNYTYPRSLKEELVKMFNYRVSPSRVLQPLMDFEEKSEVVNELIGVMETRIKLAEYCLTELNADFVHVTLFYMDNLQHYLLGSKEDLELLFRAWREVDKRLGELFKIMEEYDGLVFLMSDHGMAKLKATLYLNNLLLKEGYLSLSKTRATKDFMSRLLSKIDIFRVYRLLQKKPFNFVLKLVPERMLLKAWFTLKRNPYEVSLNELISSVDWSDTIALGVSDHGIYINREVVKDYDSVRKEIIELLKSLKAPMTMESPFEEIYSCEDLYRGQCSEVGLDVVFLWRDGYLIHPSLRLPLNQVWLLGSREGYSGFHKFYGFFGAWGSGIKKRFYTGFDVTIADLAPTILFVFNIDPSGLEMEGRVLADVFSEDFVKSRKLEDLRDKLIIYRKLRRLKGFHSFD